MGKMVPSVRGSFSICPRSGKRVVCKPQTRWATWLLSAAGLLSLAWFLVRVIPKPSRAAYPCQRMAFPLASGFVVWLTGLIATVVAFGRAREFVRRGRVVLATVCCLVASVAGLHTLFNVPAAPVVAAAPPPYGPLGIAKGIHPGRVVLVRDPKATDWGGVGDGYWWAPNHADQAAVDAMLSLAVRSVAGCETDEAAWDTLFRHFNGSHGRGGVGYAAGEGIYIKCNNVAQIGWLGWVDSSTYEQTSQHNMISVAPQMMLAVLRQLVYKAGVPQECISIGDPVCYFANHQWNACHGEFPNVKYLDLEGKFGRTAAVPSAHPLYWSKPGVNPQLTDHIPVAAAEATYFISLPHLKAHQGGGISLSGKNLYGSLCRYPYRTDYYYLHDDLPYITSGMGHYRTLVDLLGHADFGGKALLWLMDGLWSGTDSCTYPQRWYKPPFNGDWPSCVMASQDPIAIDSVGLDMCYMEWPTSWPSTVDGADDYLHEAALAPNPPSGIFYDPERDGVGLTSLGVHEHWNNSTDRQYSRNLDPAAGTGIELLWLNVTDPGDINGDKSVDVEDLLWLVECFGSYRGDATFAQEPDLNFDGMVDVVDLLILVENFGTIYP